MDEFGLRALSSSPAREEPIAVLLQGEETAGRCGLVETVEERGVKPPRHLHHREDETLYVIEGSLGVWVSGRWVEAPAGTAVFLPRGAEHTFVAATERARVLSFFGPAGFEGFYRDLGAAGPPDVERLVTTAARYGCEITGPPPKQPRAADASPMDVVGHARGRDGQTREVRVREREK